MRAAGKYQYLFDGKMQNQDINRHGELIKDRQFWKLSPVHSIILHYLQNIHFNVFKQKHISQPLLGSSWRYFCWENMLVRAISIEHEWLLCIEWRHRYCHMALWIHFRIASLYILFTDLFGIERYGLVTPLIGLPSWGKEDHWAKS